MPTLPPAATQYIKNNYKVIIPRHTLYWSATWFQGDNNLYARSMLSILIGIHCPSQGQERLRDVSSTPLDTSNRSA